MRKLFLAFVILANIVLSNSSCLAQSCCIWTSKSFLALAKDKQDEVMEGWNHMFGVGMGVVFVSNKGLDAGTKEAKNFIDLIDEKYLRSTFYDMLYRYPNKYAHEVYGEAVGMAVGRGFSKKNLHNPQKK
jgi:hypothetical protein